MSEKNSEVEILETPNVPSVKKSSGRPPKATTPNATPVKTQTENNLPPITGVRLASAIENPPVVKQAAKPPPPTPFQQGQAFAEALGNEEAKRTRQYLDRGFEAEKKAQQDFNKAVGKSNLFYEQNKIKCQKLNDYRFKYGGRDKDFPFNFHKDYTPDMGNELLDAHLQQVQLILSTGYIPKILKDSVNEIAKVIEKTAFYLGYPILSGFEKNIRTINATEAWDEEYEQLAIEWKRYFAQPPQIRLGFKIFMTGLHTVQENISAETRRQKDEVYGNHSANLNRAEYDDL